MSLRNKLLNIYKNNEYIYTLCIPLKKLRRLLFYYLVPDRVAIKHKFKKKLGYQLNLKDPKTFPEKLQWLKLYDRKAWYSDCADKFKVRDYVSRKMGTDKYLIPLFYETENWRDIKIENMPDEPFVIKCNHDNTSYMIIKDKHLVDWKKIRFYYRRRLEAMNFFWVNREWPYKNIKPRVIVEKFLCSVGNEYNLQEYKFHCFGGEIKVVSFYEYGCDGIKRHCFMNKDYEILDDVYSMNVNLEKIRKYNKTNIIDELNYFVNTLAEDFEYYIRVDVYQVDGKLYIGELTFFDSAGFEKISPESWNLELGNYLKLPVNNN